MVETFVSREKSARARGEAFGARFAAQIASNIEIYQRLFLLQGKRSIEEIRSIADGVVPLVRSHSPNIADEIEGMARGANVLLSDLMALNARTELLAVCGGLAQPECSAVIWLNRNSGGPAPLALQTWDWLSELSNGWLVWTIVADDGHVVRTLTEYGIVGKIGVSSAGVGVLLNILSHERDGQIPIGLPVHIAARIVLDERVNLSIATARIAGSTITASSSLSVVAKSGDDVTAFALELFPGGPGFYLPTETGLLVHTNHFLSLRGAMGDRAPKWGSSSFSRFEQLRRNLYGKNDLSADEVIRVLSSHVGGSHALCCHPIPDARFGEKGETLAVVQLDICSGELTAQKGGPCAYTSK